MNGFFSNFIAPVLISAMITFAIIGVDAAFFQEEKSSAAPPHRHQAWKCFDINTPNAIIENCQRVKETK